jgi:hypothetical protein
MATVAQIAANRLNAKKSTGPKSRKGKYNISNNALKHGLFARQAIISTEDKDEFGLYRDEFLAELDPETPVESMLAERIINLSWRLFRVVRIQNQTIDAMNTPDSSNPLTKLTESILKNLNKSQPLPPEPPHDLLLGRLAIKDFSNERVLEKLLMYERRLESSLYKSMIELQRLNLLKDLNNDSVTRLKQQNL